MTRTTEEAKELRRRVRNRRNYLRREAREKPYMCHDCCRRFLTWDKLDAHKCPSKQGEA